MAGGKHDAYLQSRLFQIDISKVPSPYTPSPPVSEGYTLSHTFTGMLVHVHALHTRIRFFIAIALPSRTSASSNDTNTPAPALYPRTVFPATWFTFLLSHLLSALIGYPLSLFLAPFLSFFLISRMSSSLPFHPPFPLCVVFTFFFILFLYIDSFSFIFISCSVFLYLHSLAISFSLFSSFLPCHGIFSVSPFLYPSSTLLLYNCPIYFFHPL